MTTPLRIAIIDYGGGNVRSVQRALMFRPNGVSDLSPILPPGEAVPVEATLTDDPDAIRRADAVVFPGQGAAGQSLAALRERGLDQVIIELITDPRKPFLGVCIGLQVLFDYCEENDTPGLGVLRGASRRFAGEKMAGLKIPEIGWNQVTLLRPDLPLFDGLPPDPYFYFVHSYYADPTERDMVIGTTDYGITYCSAAGNPAQNWFALQFHPEKSGPVGLRVYQNFARYAANI